MQPMQVFSSTMATAGSRSSSSALNRLMTLAPVALAMATASGMSRGAWQAPATKTPAVFVSTGRSLGCASLMKPCSSVLTLSVCASSRMPGCGRMAVASTTMSASMTTCSPLSVS